MQPPTHTSALRFKVETASPGCHRPRFRAEGPGGGRHSVAAHRRARLRSSRESSLGNESSASPETEKAVHRKLIRGDFKTRCYRCAKLDRRCTPASRGSAAMIPKRHHRRAVHHDPDPRRRPRHTARERGVTPRLKDPVLHLLCQTARLPGSRFVLGFTMEDYARATSTWSLYQRSRTLAPLLERRHHDAAGRRGLGGAFSRVSRNTSTCSKCSPESIGKGGWINCHQETGGGDQAGVQAMP